MERLLRVQRSAIVVLNHNRTFLPDHQHVGVFVFAKVVVGTTDASKSRFIYPLTLSSGFELPLQHCPT